MRQCVELRGERELAAFVSVVERLDSEAVPRERQARTARIPDRDDCEHAAQALPEARPPFLVPVDKHLGVAACPERMAGALEFVLELAVVVELAVLHDDDGPVLVRDRLVAAGQVDDRKSARSDSDGSVDVHAFGVGAAVDERRGHPAEPLAVDGAAAGSDPADPAHGGSV